MWAVLSSVVLPSVVRRFCCRSVIGYCNFVSKRYIFHPDPTTLILNVQTIALSQHVVRIGRKNTFSLCVCWCGLVCVCVCVICVMNDASWCCDMRNPKTVIQLGGCCCCCLCSCPNAGSDIASADGWWCWRWWWWWWFVVDVAVAVVVVVPSG